jgi:restriction system protein
MAETIIWGIHGGRTGDANELFLKQNRIAIGWNALVDLSTLANNRDAFKASIAKAYPTKKSTAIPVAAGQLYRFVHEMKPGDLVAYPSKQDRHIHLGRITGPYQYDPTNQHHYPHRRSVEWLKSVPRTKFTQGALYEIGSALTLFQIKNYADEYLAILNNQAVAPPVDADESVAEIAEDIEETTWDFVLKTLAQELKGHPFGHFVAHLLNTMGYRTRVSPEGPDGGIDVIAHKDELGFEPPVIKVQIKSTEGKVGDPEVSALYGKVGPGEFGLLFTLGTFTKQATDFARSKTNLRLIDGETLVNLILTHYEQFDTRYKSILPLKRVWVPETPIVSEE